MLAVFAAPVDAGFVDNSNGTVTDTATGLTWQKATAPGTYTWEQALAYCEALTLGGRSDWRLPTRKELRSIVDYSRYNPAINTTYFPDTAASWYWSSTTYAFYTNAAWGVGFDYGYDYHSYKRDSGYVRAVRGGQSGSLGYLVISAATPQQAGVPFSVTVTAKDGYGNVMTGVNGEVFLNASMGVVSPKRVVLAGGTGSREICILSPGKGYIYASGVGLTGTSVPMDIQGEGYNTAVVRGYVETEDKTRIADVEVFLETADGGSVIKTTSGADGSFSFTGLARVPYILWAKAMDGRESDKQSIYADFTLAYLTVKDPPNTAIPVLFVPGIMGSTIGDGIYPELPENSPPWNSTKWHEDGLHDPFDKPGWRKLKEKFKETSNKPDCYEVPYDWRLDLRDIVDKYLIKKIDDAKIKSKTDKVDIVAHSMGGLVVRKYIQDEGKYRNDIRNLVMVGTPNHGAGAPYYMYYGGDPASADGLGKLFSIVDFYGQTTNLNYKEIYGEELFPMVYTGQFYYTDWKNPAARVKARKFYRDLCPSVLTLMSVYPFLSTSSACLPALDENRTLIDLNNDFNDDFARKGINAMILAGKDEKTLEWIKVGSKNAFYKYGAPKDNQDLPKAGDGTVLKSSAQLGSVFFHDGKEGEHSGLINTYREEIVGFIADGVCPAAAVVKTEAKTVDNALAITEETAFLSVSFSGDIDPQGRKLGIDPASGELVDDFGYADAMQETGNGSYSIPNPVNGVYSLAVSGDSEREYRLALSFMNASLSDHAEATGYRHGNQWVRTFTLNALAEKIIVLTDSPETPKNVIANAVVGATSTLTRLSWDAAVDPSVSRYRIYGRLSDEPLMTVLGETTALFYNTGHEWANPPGAPARVYAVAALKADGTESFLSGFVKNDDRDHDGLTDAEETAFGSDMTKADTDGEGLTDGEEYLYGTSPVKIDTDGDGFSDKEEVDAGSDPLDKGSLPVPAGVIPAINLLLLGS